MKQARCDYFVICVDMQIVSPSTSLRNVWICGISLVVFHSQVPAMKSESANANDALDGQPFENGIATPAGW